MDEHVDFIKNVEERNIFFTKENRVNLNDNLDKSKFNNLSFQIFLLTEQAESLTFGA